MRACGAFSWSCELISDQRLDGAVEADIWEGREAAGRERQGIWRPETHEADLAVLGLPAFQRGLGVLGQVAGEDGELLAAVERSACR